jgi:predicted RNase H-like HicB family nuclease
MRTVQVVLYRERDGYVAQCLDVDVQTGGETEAEARSHLRDALEFYFQQPAAEAYCTPVTEVRVEQLTVAAHARDPAGCRPASGGPCLR